MSAWEFPTSLNVGGVDYEIRTDYRVVLDLFTALSDPDLTDDDERMTAYMQSKVIMEIMFPDCDNIPMEHWQEALDKVSDFIDMGLEEENKNKPKLMDWNKDAPLIRPQISKILGYEVLEPRYTHWWSFLGAYMDIGECLFASVIAIRQKKAKGKKLEKHEQEFYNENKSLIDFNKVEKRSKEEKDALMDILYGHKKK